MPSTFTSNTGIELIADGEQTGAWGQTTNDNFDIVDRALNGSVSISLVGTTHTLTTSNGVLSDGQAAVLVFTGSPSGTNTVTIAPNTAQKTYFVTNSTAQTVVLSQGSGANVSVPAGLSKIVFTDGAGAGAAVFDLTNTLSGTFTGNLTGNVTGNVTGNASTATALQTARTIGGVSFNGTADINLPGVNTAGNQNTTGNATTATLAASATALQTARTIGGVSFNGTANINLPGVNTAGNQNTTGNAATATLATAATALQNARTINGVSFNGTADITVPTIPSGGIIMWSGSIASIPSGFFLCDGTNGTPDLRDRFVVGAGSTYAVNDTGGADTVTLTTAQLPAHGHTFSGTTNTTGAHTHGIVGKTFDGSGASITAQAVNSGNRFRDSTTTSAGNHNHTFSGTTASVGSGNSHENRPPYLALAYIMKA